MWSVFLFARRLAQNFARLFLVSVAGLCFAVPCNAAEGLASFASLLAGGLSPVGLGGYHSTPARYANPSYGLSYYWMDEVDESSWNLSLEFGSDTYRVSAFVAYLSMDSLYRNLYSEFSYARPCNLVQAMGLIWNGSQVEFFGRVTDLSWRSTINGVKSIGRGC